MKLARSREWWLRLAEHEGYATVLAGAPDRCPHCDDTGDVHRADGEWLGKCGCGAPHPDPNVRGPHNGWMTPEDYLQLLAQLGRMKTEMMR